MANGFASSSIYQIDNFQWEGEKCLSGSTGDDAVTFDQVLITKKTSGLEEIVVVVEYRNRWNLNEFNDATEDTGPLKISIRIV